MTAATAKMTEGEVLTGEVVPRSHGGRTQLQPYEELALMRELAAGDVTQKKLGEKYGMSQPGICQFAKRHARQIEEIRENISDIFAGLPIARKENRIAAYMAEIERLSNHPHADHHEWSKARMIALRNVAEETGQLPPRQSITVIPVTHVIEGVSMEDL